MISELQAFDAKVLTGLFGIYLLSMTYHFSCWFLRFIVRLLLPRLSKLGKRFFSVDFFEYVQKHENMTSAQGKIISFGFVRSSHFIFLNILKKSPGKIVSLIWEVSQVFHFQLFSLRRPLLHLKIIIFFHRDACQSRRTQSGARPRGKFVGGGGRRGPPIRHFFFKKAIFFWNKFSTLDLGQNKSTDCHSLWHLIKN